MQALYPLAREKFLTAQIDWSATGDDFLLVALDSTGVYLPTDEFRSDLVGVLGTATIPNPISAGDGTADADDVVFTGLSYGDLVEAIVICRDTGLDSTDDLIYYADTQTDGTDIARYSDGVNPITFVWSATTARIFRI